VPDALMIKAKTHCRCPILVLVRHRAHQERKAGCGALFGLPQGHHAHQDAGDECE